MCFSSCVDHARHGWLGPFSVFLTLSCRPWSDFPSRTSFVPHLLLPIGFDKFIAKIAAKDHHKVQCPEYKGGSWHNLSTRHSKSCRYLVSLRSSDYKTTIILCCSVPFNAIVATTAGVLLTHLGRQFLYPLLSKQNAVAVYWLFNGISPMTSLAGKQAIEN